MTDQNQPTCVEKEPKMIMFKFIEIKVFIQYKINAFRSWVIRKLGGVPVDWKETGNLVDHAKTEMNLAWPESDDMQDEVKKAVIDLISVFANQGHSGMSAPYVANVANKMMLFKQLRPITGEEDEWCILDYDDNMYAQNKRCSSIFMRKDGSAYDIDGRIFFEYEPESGEWIGFTSGDSKVDIEFPYEPGHPEYVYVDEDRNVLSREQQ